MYHYRCRSLQVNTESNDLLQNALVHLQMSQKVSGWARRWMTCISWSWCVTLGHVTCPVGLVQILAESFTFCRFCTRSGTGRRASRNCHNQVVSLWPQSNKVVKQSIWTWYPWDRARLGDLLWHSDPCIEWCTLEVHVIFPGVVRKLWPSDWTGSPHPLPSFKAPANLSREPHGPVCTCGTWG